MKFQYVISPPFLNRSSWNLTCTFPSDNVPTHLVARARSAISDCLVSKLSMHARCDGICVSIYICLNACRYNLTYICDCYRNEVTHRRNALQSTRADISYPLTAMGLPTLHSSPCKARRVFSKYATNWLFILDKCLCPAPHEASGIYQAVSIWLPYIHVSPHSRCT